MSNKTTSIFMEIDEFIATRSDHQLGVLHDLASRNRKELLLIIEREIAVRKAVPKTSNQ